MKRDWDLIRELLNFFEANLDGKNPIDTIHIHLDNYTTEEISYHVGLLARNDLIEANEFGVLGDPSIWTVIRMTSSGHEFLELARNDTPWKNAKEIMVKIGSFAIDVMKTILIDQAKKAMTGSSIGS
jgi:hypothetical protein